MTIEFRSLDASKTSLAVHDYSASAAHAGPVDHHRIQADVGSYIVRLGQIAYSFHHRYRTDRVNRVDISALKDQISQRIDNQSCSPVTAVIGDYIQLIAGLTHFVFQDQQISCARAD